MSQENVEIAKRLIDAYNRRDLDAYDDLYTPDFERFPALVRVSRAAAIGDGKASKRISGASATPGRSSAWSVRSFATSVTACSCSVGWRDAE
jgi:ketosteroid isomerase-like protein